MVYYFRMFRNKWSVNWRPLAQEMVQQQIEARGVKDERVLEAMRNTPRHKFVPGARVKKCYGDHPMSIGFGQTISQPYIVGYMTELLRLTGKEQVLEIGTGCGYQAAILSQVTSKVFSMEIVGKLARRAANTLTELKMQNVRVMHGDGYQGWPEEAPFDRIIITAAPPMIPDELCQQLKVGGWMIVPVGEEDQKILVVTRTESGFKTEEKIRVRFVPMVSPV